MIFSLLSFNKQTAAGLHGKNTGQDEHLNAPSSFQCAL